jgi:hypothetical protein
MQHNEASIAPSLGPGPWNKGKLIGAKPPLQPKHVWSWRSVFCRRWWQVPGQRARAQKLTWPGCGHPSGPGRAAAG